jgi:hypothetical protein
MPMENDGPNVLDVLMEKLEDARKNVDLELLRIYPKGHSVLFYLQDGQFIPSRGIVHDLDVFPGRLRVLLSNAKPGSRRAVRSVHYKSII